MPEFKLNGNTFVAEDCVDGILVNPVLPRLFDFSPNSDRSTPHFVWWDRPYIVTLTVDAMDALFASRSDLYAEVARKHWIEDGRASWMNVWPSGTRFETCCLDGGTWDRATSWGLFQNIEAAIECARTGHTLNIKEKFHDYSQTRG